MTFRPGQTISSIPAKALNAAMRLAEAGVDRSGDVQPAARTLRVRNDSGVAVPPGGVLAVSGIVETTPAAGFIQRLPTLRGVIPAADHAEKFVILKQGLAAGEVGECVASGVAVARVKVMNTSHPCATVCVSEVSCLESSASGMARILWREDVPDPIRWAVVRLGGGGGGGGAGTLDNPYPMPLGETGLPEETAWNREQPPYPDHRGVGTRVLQRIHWSGVPGEAVLGFFRRHWFDDAGGLAAIGIEEAAPLFWTGSCDVSIPAPHITLAEGSPTNATSLTFSWVGATGYVGGTGTFRYRIGTESWSELAANSVTIDAPAEGAHVFQVQEKYLTDHWGATGTCPFVIDRTAPTDPSFLLSTVTVTNNPRPLWQWESHAASDWTDGLHHFELVRSWTSTYGNYAGLSYRNNANMPEGTHTLTIREFDRAGNYSGEVSHTITIDLTPPAAPVVSLHDLVSPIQRPAYTSVSVMFLWDPGDNTGNGTFRYRTNSVYPWTAWTETTDRYVTITRSTTHLGFTMMIEVQERDEAGNWSASGTQSLVVEIAS